MYENTADQAAARPTTRADVVHTTGVSWAAIIAGAAGAASLSLILLVLGVGLGLSSVSPWATEGLSAKSFGVSTILWLTFTQFAAAGIGGYLAGRLRTRWAAVHTDEVYFRDTAHGFLAWSIATLATAAMLGSAVTAVVGTGAKAGAALAGGASTAAVAAVPAAAAAASGASNGSRYFVDTLFRKDASALAPEAAASSASAATSTAAGTGARKATPVWSSAANGTPVPTMEVGRIFANAAETGTLAPADTKYVAQLVSQQTGLSQADAEKRVTDTFNRFEAKLKDAEAKAREIADDARKASAYAALWVFISLLIGAFVASLAATFGGRQRDLV